MTNIFLPAAKVIGAGLSTQQKARKHLCFYCMSTCGTVSVRQSFETKNQSGISGESLVLTPEGYLPIKDILPGNHVLTENGEFEEVTQISCSLYSGELYNVRAKYHPLPIVCGSEQQFLVRTKVQSDTFLEPCYKKASEITQKDFLGMVVNTKEILPPAFSVQKKVNQIRTDTVSLTLNDPEMFWILGYFVGDGWIIETLKKDGRPTYRIEFVINIRDEPFVLPKIQKTLPIYMSKNRITVKEFQCRNILWFSIFKRFGKYAHGKKIPEFIQNTPIPFLQHFVDGYMRADGYRDKVGRGGPRTVSPDLAYGSQRLFLKLGFIYGVSLDLRASEIKHKIKGRVVNQRPIYSVSGVNRATAMSSFIEKDFAWFLPYKIHKKTHIETLLYTLKLKNNISFVVENLILKQ